MADPLTALATVAAVSSILQVVDFLAKVISETNRLVRSNKNATEENFGVEALMKEYSELSCQVLSSNNARRPLNANEQAVDKLANSCKEETLELLKLLDGLKLDESIGGSKKIIHSARKAVSTVRNRPRIEQQQKQVIRLYDALSGRLMHILRATQSADMETLLEMIDHNQNKQVDAILQSKEEILRAIESSSEQLDVSNSQLRTEMDMCIDRQRSRAGDETSKLIIESLYLPEMRLRRDGIPLLSEDSASWFFEEDRTLFNSWLRSPEDIFWLFGKVGSGKSTLMKALCHHQRTKESLGHWTGGGRLIITDTYLWSSVNPLQRRELGLLQPLLYQILSRNPDLIEVATPSRWRSDLSYLLRPDPWSRRELSQALNSVLRNCESNIHFCIFIDALDEYDGDLELLVHRLRDLASHSRIKICVSSRPWSVFYRAFGDMHTGTHLQDLTYDALRSFIGEELSLLVQDNRMADTLQHEIIQRAQGVFLWAVLFLQSLKKEFKSGDSVLSIRSALLRHPPDLDELFPYLLRSNDIAHRQQTLQALKLATITLGRYRPFHVLNSSSFLSFWLLSKGILGNARFAFEQRFQSVSSRQLREMVEEAKQFIATHDTGLLQLTSMDITPSTWRPNVEFLHRSVYDFLHSPDADRIWRDSIPAHFESSMFPAHLALAQCKFVPHEVVQSCEHITEIILSAIRTIEGEPSALETLAEFEKVALYYWDHRCILKCPLHVLRTKAGTLMLQMASSFISYGLFLYAERTIDTRPSYVQESETGAWPMLRPTLGMSSSYAFPTVEINLVFLEKLLDNGANPNCLEVSLWHDFLIKAVREAPLWSEKDIEHVAKIVSTLASYCADMDSNVTLPPDLSLGVTSGTRDAPTARDVWTALLPQRYLSRI